MGKIWSSSFCLVGLFLVAQSQAATPKPDWRCGGGDTAAGVDVYYMGKGGSQGSFTNSNDPVDLVKLVVTSDNISDRPSRMHYFGEVISTADGVEIIAFQRRVLPAAIGGVFPESVFLKIKGDISLLAFGGSIQHETCQKP